jgi:hypothetical protein
MTEGGAVRAMLDSNAFDKLLVIDDAINVLNDLTDRCLLLTTHVQRDELAVTPEPKGPKLLAVYDRLVMTEVPTAGAIWGVSKFGQAKFGDGGTGPDSLLIGDIMTTNPKDEPGSSSEASSLKVDLRGPQPYPYSRGIEFGMDSGAPCRKSWWR